MSYDFNCSQKPTEQMQFCKHCLCKMQCELYLSAHGFQNEVRDDVKAAIMRLQGLCRWLRRDPPYKGLQVSYDMSADI